MGCRGPGGSAPVCSCSSRFRRRAAEREVIELAAAQGLALEGLSWHWHTGAGPSRGLVIGFSRPAESAYPAAVATLAGVLAETLP